MSITARDAAERLRSAAQQGELAEVCARERIVLMVMFGSAATGDPAPGDVDVAVRFANGASRNLLSLLDQLYLLTGYEDFDVLDLGRAGPVARERALVGAQILHQAKLGLFANQQIAAIMERMDTAPFRRLELELMTR